MTNTGLMTDKYEFTMLQAALKSGVAHQKAVFELFTRRLPEGRTYGVVGGTNRAIEAVKNFTFNEKELEFLSGHLNEETVEYLRNYKFSGTITGHEEGDLFFRYTPVLTVEATFGEGVILETILLSIFNYDSAVASQASRIRTAAGTTPLQELGARRVNEDAAVVAARAAYIAGWDGTSNLLAAERFGIPVFGTSAHAFVLAHDTELAAFYAQVAGLGTSTTLLVDTYSTEHGIRKAVEAAGPDLGAIRLDSGDPFVEIPAARELLDSLGATKTRIIFSGDLDHDVVKGITDAGLPIDGFGIGSDVVTGGGYPNCGFVYKVVSIEDSTGVMRSVAKASRSKASLGGRKDSYVAVDQDGKITAQHLYVEMDTEGENLEKASRTFIQDGTVVLTQTVEEAREVHARQVKKAPAESIPTVLHLLDGSVTEI